MTLLWILVLAVLGFAGGYLIFNADTAVEEQRRAALEMVTWCRENGLEFLADPLEDYVIGDYSGLLSRVKRLRDRKHWRQLQEGVNLFFAHQFDKRLADPVAREELLAYLREKTGTGPLDG